MADQFATSTTSTTGVGSGLVKAAYDQLVEFALRSQPLYRDFVDKRPGQPAMPGSSVILSLYNDLTANTTALTEGADISSTLVPAVSTVTITPLEYGDVVTRTAVLDLESFSAVDPAIANMVAYTMQDALDKLVAAKLIAGTNVITSAAGAVESPAVATNTLAATDVFSSKHVRYVVSKLRGASSMPRKGSLYGCVLHPDTSHDLRVETGSPGWRLPHEYSAPDAIWAGEVGTFEGAYFIETPRAYNANDGAVSAKVHRTLFFGAQALAEAVVMEPQVKIGPVIDKLGRYRHIGWNGILSWAVYRQASLYRVEHGSTY